MSHQGTVTLKNGDGTVLLSVPFNDDDKKPLSPTDIQNAYSTLEGAINPNDPRFQGVDLSDATVEVEEAPENAEFSWVQNDYAFEDVKEKSTPVLATTAFHSSSVYKLFQAPMRALTQDERYTNEPVDVDGVTKTIAVSHVANVLQSFGTPGTEDFLMVSMTQKWNQGKGENAYMVFEGDNGQLFRTRTADFSPDKDSSYEVQKADGTWVAATMQTVIKTGGLPGSDAISVGSVDRVSQMDRPRHIQKKATALYTEKLIDRHTKDNGEVDLNALYQEIDSGAFENPMITVNYALNDRMQQMQLPISRSTMEDYLKEKGLGRPETVAKTDDDPHPRRYRGNKGIGNDDNDRSSAKHTIRD